MAKKVNFIQSELTKVWLRLTDSSKYLDYKLYLKEQKIIQKYSEIFESVYNKTKVAIEIKEEINFKHSGHIGDLMYALPVIKEISKTKKCNFYICTNHILGKKGYYKHPSGNIMISDKVLGMILPLLKNQLYLNKVKKWENEIIDVDLDLFRNLPFSNDFHSIRWYYHIVGKQIDMALPYIEVEPSLYFQNKIVIVRTFRGRNPLINYNFLNKYEDLLFLGTRSEYDDFLKIVPSTIFHDVQDFLELAQIMKSAKLVISNQTFAFSVAEGLKVNRILEANPYIPAVFPIGGNGVDFYFQDQFENQVKEMIS